MEHDPSATQNPTAFRQWLAGLREIVMMKPSPRKVSLAIARRDTIRFWLIFTNGMFWLALTMAGSYLFPPPLTFFINTLAFLAVATGAWLVETLVK